jgi:hypothetical protein
MNVKEKVTACEEACRELEKAHKERITAIEGVSEARIARAVAQSAYEAAKEVVVKAKAELNAAIVTSIVKRSGIPYRGTEVLDEN